MFDIRVAINTQQDAVIAMGLFTWLANNIEVGTATPESGDTAEVTAAKRKRRTNAEIAADNAKLLNQAPLDAAPPSPEKSAAELKAEMEAAEKEMLYGEEPPKRSREELMTAARAKGEEKGVVWVRETLQAANVKRISELSETQLIAMVA